MNRAGKLTDNGCNLHKLNLSVSAADADSEEHRVSSDTEDSVGDKRTAVISDAEAITQSGAYPLVKSIADNPVQTSSRSRMTAINSERSNHAEWHI